MALRHQEPSRSRYRLRLKICCWVPEENTLAIMKARLAAMSPSYRWHPALKRYIDYVSARVDGSGGDADDIAPSFDGTLERR